MLEFHVPSISPLHLKDFQLLWSCSHEHIDAKNNHIGRRIIKFTYSQVRTSECIWNKKYLKRSYRLHYNCEIYFSLHDFYTCKLEKCHHAALHQGMHCF